MNKSEKFWNKLSKNYDKPENISQVYQFESYKYMTEHFDNNDIVLDFGCATGTMACALADKVKEVHGIDISPKMIEIAKRRAVEREITNVSFSQSSIFDEGNKKNSYDIVMAFSILHLLEDTEKIMKRTMELLKPGGLYVSLTPCLGEKKLLSSLLRFIYKIRILPFIKCFKIAELEKAIISENFQIIKSTSIDNNPLEHFIIAKKG